MVVLYVKLSQMDLAIYGIRDDMFFIQLLYFVLEF